MARIPPRVPRSRAAAKRRRGVAGALRRVRRASGRRRARPWAGPLRQRGGAPQRSRWRSDAPPGMSRAPPAGGVWLVAAALAVSLDLDLLARHVLGHGALLGLDVLVEPHALLRDHALLGHGLLLVQDNLVLLLRQRRPVHRRAGVRVGDRLALEADLLTAHRDGLLDLLGHHVLLQAGTARLALPGADGELLLGARHRVVGLRSGDVVAHRRGAAEGAGRACVAADVVGVRVRQAAGRGVAARPPGVVVPVGRAVAASRVADGRATALAQAGVGVGLGVAHAVVPVEVGLLLLGELAVRIDLRRVLDLRLLERHLQPALGLGGVADRHEGLLGPEQAGADERPLRLAGLRVEVDLFDGADLAAVVVAEVLTAEREDAVLLD